MAEFKTLQFPNTSAGQAEKVRALEKLTAEGWRVVSETIIPGRFKGGKACCLFLIFAQCAFLAGLKDDIISVTLQRDSVSQTISDSVPENRPSFDQSKWKALLQYDSDIATVESQVRQFGVK